MSERWNGRGGGPADEPGSDAALPSALALIDPASGDPNYWLRFRDWVLRNAAPELARRRLMAELTVGDVMTSWARAVVPTAVLAATLAGIILLRGQQTPGQELVSVDELVLAEVGDVTVPADLRLGETASVVAFAEEGF